MRCCGKKIKLSTFACCCCCCSVPVSQDNLPELDDSRKQKNNDPSLIFYQAIHTNTPAKQDQKTRIRVVTVSDTHMRHNKLNLPDGDILILAGDITNWRTSNNDISKVCEWIKTLENKYDYRIVIAGNHETSINENNKEKTKQMFLNQANAIYLQDDYIIAHGLKIFGSPWHPKRGCLYRAEAFGVNLNTIKKYFEQIPSDTNIIITHVPPHGIRDEETAGHIGSEILKKEIIYRIKPYLHVFGHVHHGNGISFVKNCPTAFVNTAIIPRINEIIFSNDPNPNENEEEKYKTVELKIAENNQMVEEEMKNDDDNEDSMGS